MHCGLESTLSTPTPAPPPVYIDVGLIWGGGGGAPGQSKAGVEKKSQRKTLHFQHEVIPIQAGPLELFAIKSEGSLQAGRGLSPHFSFPPSPDPESIGQRGCQEATGESVRASSKWSALTQNPAQRSRARPCSGG